MRRLPCGVKRYSEQKLTSATGYENILSRVKLGNSFAVFFHFTEKAIKFFIILTNKFFSADSFYSASTHTKWNNV